ncbi:unnamed protein product [Peniophora sp. CBMAI 1063]|nr:unnamed protein product [Peniophora sp. CBMAI 1063]
MFFDVRRRRKFKKTAVYKGRLWLKHVSSAFLPPRLYTQGSLPLHAVPPSPIREPDHDRRGRKTEAYIRIQLSRLHMAEVIAETGKTRPLHPTGCLHSQKLNQRNLVVCIDGTGNAFGRKNTNVIELYSLIEKDIPDINGNVQCTYYNSGIGTYAESSTRSLRQWFIQNLDLAFAVHFKDTILDAYRWLSETYQTGDRIFLFGFSRGAYQVRVLSAMIDKACLLMAWHLIITRIESREGWPPSPRKRKTNPIVSTAYHYTTLYAALTVIPTISAYSWYTKPGPSTNSSTNFLPTVLGHPIDSADLFKTAFSRTVRVHFVGAWDTVSSLGFGRGRSELLGGTDEGMTHVCYFRHALALDERRVKFLPEYANGGRGPSARVVLPQYKFHDTKEVWFSGTHSDVGGGNIENPTFNTTRPALRWMYIEASIAGLHLNRFERASAGVDKLEPIESLRGLLYQLCEHLPFRRLVYSVAQRVDSSHETLSSTVADEQTLPHRSWPSGWWASWWIAFEIPALLLWKLIELLIWISRLLPKLFPRMLRGVWSTMLCKRTEGEAVVAEGYTKREETMFWPPHRGQGRILQPGQKIHASVWRSELAPLTETHKSVIHPILGCIYHHSLSQSKYIPSAKLPSNPHFWEHFMQPLNDVTMAPRLLDQYEQWKEVDLYDSMEDLVHQYTHSEVADPNNDEQRTQLAIMYIHAKSLLYGHDGPVRSVAYSAGTYGTLRIISGSADKTIRIWEAETGEKKGMPLVGSIDAVQSVAIDPNDIYVVGGSTDSKVRLWELETGIMSNPFEAHSGTVWSVAVSSDGERIVSGSYDRTLRVWDANSGQQIGEPLAGHEGTIYSVAISGDSMHVVSGSSDRTVRIWKVKLDTGELESMRILKEHTGTVWSVAFSPDRAHVVSGSADGTISVWSTKTDKNVEEAFTDEGYTDHRDVTAVAFSPNSKRIVCGFDSGSIGVWDIDKQRPVGQPYKGHSDGVTSVAVSPDGECIVSGSYDKTVRIWDIIEQLQPTPREL